MVRMNWGSIMKKAVSHMKTPERKLERAEALDRLMLGDLSGQIKNGKPVYTVEDAGAKFAGVLQMQIRSAGLHPNVEDAIDHIDYGKARKVGDKKYEIVVYFDKDMSRDSMSTKKEYYPVDLVDLYNDGVDHVMRQIFEHVKLGNIHVVLSSNPDIPGAHFIEDAIQDFMGNYAADYHVTKIERRIRDDT